MNAALSDYFRVTLGGNRTLGSPSNPTDGQGIVFEVIQDGTGSRTLAYGGAYSFPASIGTPVLSTTPAYHDFLAFRYDSGTTTWYCTGFVPQSVNASPYTVSQGGTGVASLTAYGLIAAGTTTTGAVQQVSAGSTGNILTSQGGSALPSFQALDSTATDIAPTGTAAVAGSTGKVPDAGHIHATQNAIPADFGFVAWTFDPGYCNASAQGTGTIMLVRFPVRQTTVLTNVNVHVITAGSALTSNGCFIGVYDSSGNRQAVTADQSAVWNSSGTKTTAFASPYTAPAGNYYLAAVANVTTSSSYPTFRAAAGVASTYLSNVGLSASSLRVATQTNQSSLPTTLTLSSNVQTSCSPICAVFT